MPGMEKVRAIVALSDENVEGEEDEGCGELDLEGGTSR